MNSPSQSVIKSEVHTARPPERLPYPIPINENYLERAFALAHFLWPERTVALEILTCALNKLKARSEQEHKRAYWRDKFLKRQITHITREEQDTLQWLIYGECDSYEKREEDRGQSGREDLVVRYIKTLVQLSTGMSSFYVNIAIHRLLYRYTTSETQRIYEAITDCYRGSDEYRRAKRWLMLKLESRFSGSLRTLKADRGEAKFELAESQARWLDLVLKCLQMFTPWSTQDRCPLKARSHPASFEDALQLTLDQESDQDKIEIARCHAFIDPFCLGHLIRALGLEPHSSKLGVPQFFMKADGNMPPPSSRLSESPLTDQETRSITNALSTEEGRRKRVIARVLVFVVDGTESARLDLREAQQLKFEAPWGTQVIEVWTEDEQGPLLLATNLVKRHPSATDLMAEFTLPLRGGTSLSITVRERGGQEERSCGVIVSVRAKNLPARTSALLGWLAHAPALPAYAGMLLLVMALVMVWNRSQEREKIDQLHMDELRTQRIRQEAHTVLSPQVSYQLVSDDVMTRGATQTDVNVVTISATAMVNFDLPLPNLQSHYNALLKSLDDIEPILVENGLSPLQNGTTSVIRFAIPSTLLIPSHSYRIELRDVTKRYSPITFTFYTRSQR